jgi:hypothetical protein
MAIHECDTFRSLHILGEHVLAAARYDAVQHIGLTVVPGGIATPPFGDSGRRVGVVDGELVVTDADGERRAPISTVRAAGEFVGVKPGAPSHVYAPATPCLLDDPLTIDAEDLAVIVDWYTLAAGALTRFRREIPADAPSDLTLWPEHFDVAIRAGEVNYGGLAGDAVVPRPYVYVGPPMSALSGERGGFWNTAFGAANTEASVRSVDDAVAFFHVGRREATALLDPEREPISPG